MTNIKTVQFCGETDDDDWKVIEQIKPEFVWALKRKDKKLTELLSSIERIAGISCDELGEIVQLRKSGKWTFKSTWFYGSNRKYEDFTTVLRGYPYSIVGKNQLIFVPNDENSYMIICVDKTYTYTVDFRVYLGIQTLFDLLPFHYRYLDRAPFDYPSYPLDPDQPLDICSLRNLYVDYASIGRYY